MTVADDAHPKGAAFESAELEQLRELILPTATHLAEAGHDLYFVGGIVRDLLLATEGASTADFSDVDLTTDARPEAIKAALSGSAEAMWTQGERFGTIGAMVADHAFEITTHRAESYDEASRKPVVTFGDDLATDLSRRDFSINAMAIDVTSGELVDPYGGQADLADRRLRTPLDPAISFTDDPLRMLRAARFIPRFDLTAAPDVIASAEELKDRLAIVSGERIHDELEKLLALAEPGPGLRFLLDTGLLGVLGLQSAEPLLDAVAATPTQRSRRAGLLLAMHDETIDEFLASLRYSKANRRSTRRVIAGVRRLLEAASVGAPDQARTERLLRELAATNGNDSLDDVLELAPLAGLDEGAVDSISATLDALRAREDLDDRSAPLEGSQIMHLLGIPAGPAVGAAVKHLEHLRLERGPLSADEASAALLGWVDR